LQLFFRRGFFVFVRLVLVDFGRLRHLDALEFGPERLEARLDHVEVVLGLGRLEGRIESLEISGQCLESSADLLEVGGLLVVARFVLDGPAVTVRLVLAHRPTSRRRRRVTVYIPYGRVSTALSVSMHVDLAGSLGVAPVQPGAEHHVRQPECQEGIRKGSTDEIGNEDREGVDDAHDSSVSSQQVVGYWIRETIR